MTHTAVNSDPATASGAERPAIVVDVPAAGAPASAVLGAVDAALAGELTDVEVRVLIGDDHPGRAALAALCDADPRVELASEDADPEPAAARVVLPPAARPGEHTLAAIRDLVEGDDTGAVEVAVPARIAPLARTALAAWIPVARRVRAERPGAGGPTRRVAAARVGLGSARVPFRGPPPTAGLGRERAEHLRHRARSATIRARFDRDAQRLTRESMRAEHECARALLLERRIAATGAARRVAWWARVAVRGVVQGARRAWWGVRAVRALARRGWRFARDQLRRRRSPAPR